MKFTCNNCKIEYDCDYTQTEIDDAVDEVCEVGEEKQVYMLCEVCFENMPEDGETIH